MNDTLKNLLHAGIGFAVSTTEKLQKWMDELVERGKEYQETLKTQKEAEQEATTTPNPSATTTTEETTTAKTTEETASAEGGDNHSRLEEIEHKVRRWIDTAVARFGFIRNDDHDKIAERIARLEDKLSQLAKDAAEQASETTTTSERV